MPRTIMLYGDSGDTKTSQGYHLVRWYLEQNPTKTVRLVNADGGGQAPYEDSGLIQSGKVSVCNLSDMTQPYASAMKLAMGYWPKWIVSKKTKERTLKLVMEDSYMNINSKNVGMYVIEGLTGIAGAWQHSLGHSDTAGFKHSWRWEEGEFSVGGLQEGHYGMMQGELQNLIKEGFNQLPVDYVVWTALIEKGENKRTGEVLYGPKGAGKAQTWQYPAWFMDCIHLATETIVSKKSDGTKSKRTAKVAWFEKHLDKDTDCPYLAKVRILPELYPKLKKLYPKGYVELGFERGIDIFYEQLFNIVNEFQSKSVVAGNVTETKDKGE